MSQAHLLPTVSPSSSLPPLTYKGLPVVTTEMLAKAYGCTPKNIQMNFANNRERFTEGKHFFILTNGEVKSFRDCTKTFGSVVPARTRNLTLWLERGAARHAKMLNTDQAWDVFEMLEETFFRVVKPQPTTLTPSTADDRKPLRSLVAAWAQVSGTPHQALWPQVKAHFQLARIDDLPVEWIGDALAFVQGKIDAAGKALPAAPENTEFLPTMFPTFEKDILDIERLIERLCNGMSIFARPGGMMYSELVRNKQLIDAVQPCISAAKNAVGTGYFMMQTARKIYGAMR
ncbi:MULTISPECIES: ORF6N domain-containing protein [unclassified Desulfovibrio]|uniref:ORF6N domain-containing protein n=1 Tax=unclassified Desulfovibrio TaxID=2593640 RepID=UPI002FD8D2EF